MACSLFTSAPEPAPADIEKAEEEIYSFFIGDEKGTSVILEETSMGLFTDDPKEIRSNVKSALPDLSREALNSFMERNQQSSALSPNMQLGTDYLLLSQEELAEISSQGNWNEVLQERYPSTNGHGYLIFSRVGFNDTLDQAVIYVGRVAGPLMGAGYYYMLEKRNGEWIIKAESMAWIS
jgi:hypothetical protein